MTHNPYSPPRAEVGDVQDRPGGEPRPRPRAIGFAVVLLILETAVGVGSFFLPEKMAELAGDFWSLGGIVALFVGVSAYLIYRVWRGDNWARYVFLFLTAISLINFNEIAVDLTGRPIGLGIDIATFTLDAAAVILLFGPGRDWFRRRS